MIVAVTVLCALAAVPVGSFLNVVVDRVPDRAPLRGRRDGEPCPPRERWGVPFQPWLARWGRAPGGGALPARWLWVELATVATWAVLAVRYGDSLVVLPLLVLAAALVAVSVVDLQLLRIPDRITFPALGLSLVAVAVVSAARGEGGALGAALFGMVAYFVLLLLPHLVYPKGMGFGDVKLALLMGLHLGWLAWAPGDAVAGPLRVVLVALVAGCVLGTVFGLAVQVVTRHRGAFPFGPALALGCLIVVLWADRLRV
ncbi:MAG: A24 family peptidase [Acidimicrobiia bacterium]